MISQFLSASSWLSLMPVVSFWTRKMGIEKNKDYLYYVTLPAWKINPGCTRCLFLCNISSFVYGAFLQTGLFEQEIGHSQQRIRNPFRIYYREWDLSYTASYNPDFVILWWEKQEVNRIVLVAELFCLVAQQKPQNIKFLVSWGEEPPQPEIQVEYWKDFLFSSLSLE